MASVHKKVKEWERRTLEYAEDNRNDKKSRNVIKNI